MLCIGGFFYWVPSGARTARPCQRQGNQQPSETLKLIFPVRNRKQKACAKHIGRNGRSCPAHAFFILCLPRFSALHLLQDLRDLRIGVALPLQRTGNAAVAPALAAVLYGFRARFVRASP